uniref:Uncharacterized protein n=1 Tax=Ditylenchus dipsaci TaxID=166011 RepID=A0A915DIZ9_9BILA
MHRRSLFSRIERRQMEDYNRLYFNMSQIDEEDSQMASLDAAEASHSSAVATPQSHAVDKADCSVYGALGTPKTTTAFQLDLSETPEQPATPCSITTSAKEAKENTPIAGLKTPKSAATAKLNISSASDRVQTPKSVATAKLDVSSTPSQMGTPKSAHTHTPRTIACPPKKYFYNPAEHLGIFMFVFRLESMFDATSMDDIQVDASQVHTALAGSSSTAQVVATQAVSAAQFDVAPAKDTSVDDANIEDILVDDHPADQNTLGDVHASVTSDGAARSLLSSASPTIKYAEKSVETTPKPVVVEKKEDDYEARLKIMEDIHLEQQFVLLEQIAQADCKFAEKDAEIAQVRQKLELTDSSARELLAKIDFLEKQNADFLQEHTLLMVSKETAEQKIAELEERSTTEVEKQFAMLEQIAQAEVKNDEKDVELAEIRQKLEVADSSSQELIVRIESLEKQNSIMAEENALLESSKESADKKVADLEERFTSEVVKQSALLEQIALLEARERDMGAEMAELRQKLEVAGSNSQELLSKIALLEKQTTQLEAINQEKEAELASARQELEAAGSSIQVLLAKTDSLEKQNLQILQENVDLLKACQERTEQKITDLEVRMRTETEKQQASLQQIALYEVKERDREVEMAEIRQKIEVADFNAQGLLGKIAKLKERSKAESEEFDEIENNLRKENFQLKRDIVRYKCELKIITVEEASKELGCDLTKII